MDSVLIAQAAACTFFGVLFCQSGLDKVVDWKGNLSWLTGHFASTPLRGVVPLLLGVVTLVEVAAGLASLAGALWVVIGKSTDLATVGIGLSCLALVMLFTGQRIAKDYPGAASLATYFGVALVALLALAR